MSSFDALQDSDDLVNHVTEQLNFLEDSQSQDDIQRNSTDAADWVALNPISDGLSPEAGRIGKLECAICLQNCIHPVLLPCSHIFCFLCVKGVANQSKRCAMCRQEIPPDFLDNPELVPTLNTELESVVFEDGYQWFYEGRNGWWQYDERTSIELEAAYKRGEQKCEVLIAGFLYIVDFDQMVQVRRTDPSRRRRIKRDLANIPKKGVAGIRISNYADVNGASPSSEESPVENVPADGASLSEDNDWSYLPIPGSSSENESSVAAWPLASKDALTAAQPSSPKSVPATPTNTPRSPEHSPTGGICGMSAPSSPGTVSSQIVDNALAEVIHNLRLCDERAAGEDAPTLGTRWNERRLPLQTEELFESDEEQHV